YVLLNIHALQFMELKVLLLKGFFTPLAAAIGFGIFQYFDRAENPKSIDEIVANFFGEQRYDAIMNAYKCLPLAMSLYVIVIAQIEASYDEHMGWIIFMIIYTGGEIGLLLKYSNMNSD